MRYAYPCQIELDQKGEKGEPDEFPCSFTISFPDLPEAHTEGNSLGEAMENAQEVLDLAVTGRLEDGEEVPEPSSLRKGQKLVPLTPFTAAKAAMLLEMRRQKIQPQELRERMGITETETRELIDPHRISSLERTTQALQVMGRAVIIEDTPETPGDHFRKPIKTGLTQGEFIRRVRRYCTHRRIRWNVLTSGAPGVRVGNRIHELPDGEIETWELERITESLMINLQQF